MSNFPAEICRTIFNNLERKDIKECRSVCKNWFTYTTQEYWKEVFIYSNRITDLKKLLKSKDCHQCFKYGLLTETLVFEPTSLEDTYNIYDDENQPSEYLSYYREPRESTSEDESTLDIFTPQEITQLMTYFPNVKKIQVNDKYYSDYLLLLLSSKLEHIKSISTINDPSFFHESCDRIYFAFCSLHSDTLTSLNYSYNEDSSFVKKNRRTNLSGLLSPFKNLTDLKFYNNANSDLTFMQVQEICPHLTLFSFDNEIPVSGSAFIRQVRRIGDAAIEFNRKLKKLYLKMNNLPVSYSNYLLKYLPNQLEHFYLYLTQLNLYKWVESVGDVHSVRFMERFRGINTFDIYFSGTMMNRRFRNGEVSDITTYFKLTHALMGNRESYCSFIGEEANSNDCRFTYDASKNLVLNYGFNLETDVFIDKDNNVDLLLPDKMTSTIGFEIINRFLLHYDDEETSLNLSRENMEDLPWLIFEHVLRNCPNLDHFELEKDTQPYIINVSPRIGVKVSYLNTNGQAYLKVVRLMNIYEHSRAFQSLLNYLPNIEVLSFCCNFSSDGFDKSKKFDNDIDLTGFSSLEYFYFYAGIKDHIGVSCVIFCFKYTDGDEKKYCYDSREKKIKSFKSIRYGIGESDVITIRVDKSVEIILHTSGEGAIAIFESGQFLDLDYPVAMEPYE